MGDGAKYAPALKPGRGTVIAMTVVTVWAVIALVLGGPALAVRALVLFTFPLIFVWIPDAVGKGMATPSMTRRLEGCPLPWGIHPNVVRVVGWLFILGIPAVWGVFHFSLK